MQAVVFLLVRRMRLPLILLICTYAVSVLGLVLIPGADGQGRPWHMDFFHAFYFVSFMGSTIGFGEIPYPFTDAQRMWTTFAIYTTVVAWLYAIGAMLAVIQDPAFRRVTRYNAFARSVRRIREPFYLVCGFGDTGAMLVRALARRAIQAVVDDIDQRRIDALEIENIAIHTPGLCADAADPATLVSAGLRQRCCAGVIALTNRDEVNLKVAITAKLINPAVPVVCRAETHDTEANMASFGTDHIINPFDTFADRLAMAIQAPNTHRVYEWMTSVAQTALGEPHTPPRGNWILCGYGRFGKAVARHLARIGVAVTIIERDVHRTGAPPGTVAGRGTEAVTLREARIETAAGLIAGTDDDTNNLSIIMTARELRPDLYIVVRQNSRGNDALFEAAPVDLVMQPGAMIARKVLALITTPLLATFLDLAGGRDEAWAATLVQRILAVTGELTPYNWGLTITPEDADAVARWLDDGKTVQLATLCRDPRDHGRRLPCVPLLLVRDHEALLLPEDTTALRRGDRLLFCGRREAVARMAWTVHNYNVLSYLHSGVEQPAGYVWRRWFSR